MEGREGSEGGGRRGERGSEDDSRCAKAWHHLGLDPLAPVGAGAGVGFRWFMRGVGRWRWDDGGWVGGNRCAATQCGSSRCRTRGQIINWVGRQNFPSMVCKSLSLGLL